MPSLSPTKELETRPPSPSPTAAPTTLPTISPSSLPTVEPVCSQLNFSSYSGSAGVYPGVSYMTWWYTDNMGTDPVSGAIVKVVFPPDATFLEARLDGSRFLESPKVTLQPSGATEVVVFLPTFGLPRKRQSTAMQWMVNNTCLVAAPIVINGR